MTYRIETISVTLSHSYCKLFKCDFYARDLYWYGICYHRESVRRLSVRSSQVGLLPRRLNAEFLKHRRKTAHRLQFYDAKDLYEISMGSSPTGRQIAFVDRSRSLWLRLTAESSCPSDGGPRLRPCAGGGRRGFINNFGDSRTLMITVTVQLTSTRLVV